MSDVARRAGVSPATVSRALRGLPNVSDEARGRVLAAVQELQYVISPAASRLASGTTGAVAVLVPYPGRWFYGQVLSGAESVFRDRSLDLLLYDLGTHATRERFFTQLPLRRRVDAVLCIAMPLDESRLDLLRSLGLPVALVGARAAGMSSVRIDDVAAARRAVRHLAELGHERIGMIETEVEEPQFLAMADRRRGYRAELRAQGLEVDRSLSVLHPVRPGRRGAGDRVAPRPARTPDRGVRRDRRARVRRDGGAAPAARVSPLPAVASSGSTTTT